MARLEFAIINKHTYDTIERGFPSRMKASYKARSIEEARVVKLNPTCDDYECNCSTYEEMCGYLFP